MSDTREKECEYFVSIQTDAEVLVGGPASPTQALSCLVEDTAGDHVAAND